MRRIMIFMALTSVLLTGCSATTSEKIIKHTENSELGGITIRDTFPEKVPITEGILVDPTFSTGVLYYKIVGNHGQTTNVLLAPDTPDGMAKMIEELSFMVNGEFEPEDLGGFFEKAQPKHTESTSDYGITFRRAQGMIEADIYELISQ